MQKIDLFYKMVNHLTPLYLSPLIPPTVDETARYNLRNHGRIQRGAGDPDPPPHPGKSQKYSFLAILVQIP